MFGKRRKKSNNFPDYQYYDLEKEKDIARQELLNNLDDKVGDEGGGCNEWVKGRVKIDDGIEKAKCFEDIERLKRRLDE